MSHYKPYPAYRDSGVEWIGQLPEHWARASIKHILSAPITDGPHETPVFLNEGVEFLSVDGIQDGELAFEGKRFISYEDHARFCKKAKPKINDVLVGKSASVGKVARVKTSNDFNVWSPLAILRSDPTKCNPAYLEFALKADSAQQQILLAGNTSTQANIGMDRLASVGIPLPPITEQHQLTKAIEQETARIEALIAKKTRFIELLKEKRQALITHAVTKGLNPDARMQDSGVEWLGQIPVHWLVAQLGKVSIARCDGPFGSGLKSEHYQADGVRVVRLQNIGWASFKDGNEAFISHQHWQDVLGCGHEVLPNDVLIGGLGDDKNPLGRACVAPANLGPAMVKADCYRFRLNTSRANPDFIALALSATARAECGYLATGATRDRLNLGLASARVVPLPPLNEQAEIVASLNRDTARIDLLADKTQRSIDLLKERRAAFITAAVTGQIDLRESA